MCLQMSVQCRADVWRSSMQSTCGPCSLSLNLSRYVTILMTQERASGMAFQETVLCDNFSAPADDIRLRHEPVR